VPLPPVLSHLPLPIIGSPLFIISHPKLVIEQCKAGVVGSMPALNARPASQLDEWLAEITETLAAWTRDHPEQPAAPFAIQGADRHQLARRAPRGQPGSAQLGRRGAA
jgi:nitronate monooxygenase